MSKTIRTWLIGVPLGLLLLVALLLVIVDIFDRPLIADPLARMVEERTGRALHMQRFDISWGWPIRLQAGNVRFANADWGRGAPLAQARAVDVAINPLQLLDGPPYARVRLTEPRVLIERSAEDAWNWQLDTEETESEEPPRLPVSLQATGGRLDYFPDPQAADPLGVNLQTLTAVPTPNEDDSQRVQISLDGSAETLPLTLDVDLTLDRTRWQGQAMLQAGDSSLSSRFTVDTGNETPRIEGVVEGERLAPMQLAGLLPETTEPEAARSEADSATMDLPPLDAVQADVELRLVALRLPQLTLEAVNARLRLDEGELILSPLEGRLGQVDLRAEATMDSLADQPVAQVRVELPRAALSSLPGDLPLAAQPGEIAGLLRARLHMPERQLPLTLAAALARLSVPTGDFLYAPPPSEEQASEVNASLRIPAPGGEPSLALATRGLDLPPVEATVSGPPIRQLATGDYPLTLELVTGGAAARLQALLGDLLDPGQLQLELEASGDSLPAVPAFDFEPPEIEPFRVAGLLRRDGERWALGDLEIDYADTSLNADAILDLAGERPSLLLEARAGTLNLATLQVPGNDSEPGDPAETAPDTEAGGEPAPWLPEGVADALHALDIETTVTAERIRFPGEQVIENLQFTATLEQGELRVDPLALEVAGGRLDGTANAVAGPPVTGQVDIALEGIQLGRLGDTFTPLEEYLGRLDGQVRVRVEETPRGQEAGDIFLPTLGELAFGETRLHFQDDEVDTDLTVRLESTSSASPDDQPGIRIEGEGRYRGEPAHLDLNADRLLALRDQSSPYALRLDLMLAETELHLDGEVARPLSPQAAELDFAARGGDPRRLQAVLGPLFPGRLPPYDVAGTLIYQNQRLIIRDFAGAVGDSDVRGQFAVGFADGNPEVIASLRSDTLDLDDLTGLLGGTPASGPDETAAPEQEEEAEAMRESPKLVPQTPFDLEAMQRLTVDVDYVADEVMVATIPLQRLVMDVRMEEGHLMADIVRFETGHGEVTLAFDLQAGETTLEGSTELEVRHVNLAETLAQLDLAANSVGTIGGQAKLWMSGDSPAGMLASADGGLMLMMSGGALDSLLVELAGLDLGETLVVLFGESSATTINCAYASLHSRGGQMDIEQLVIDTEDSTFFVEGGMDLGAETLDLTLYPEAKDVSVLAADSPITIAGTMKSPEVGVVSEGLVTRTLESIGLGILAGPAGALLPFLEAGEQEEPPLCRGWVDQLQEEHQDAS